jgi:hypothetical protein
MTQEKSDSLIKKILSIVINENIEEFNKIEIENINKEVALKTLYQIIQKRGGYSYLIDIIERIKWD